MEQFILLSAQLIEEFSQQPINQTSIRPHSTPEMAGSSILAGYSKLLGTTNGPISRNAKKKRYSSSDKNSSDSKSYSTFHTSCSLTSPLSRPAKRMKILSQSPLADSTPTRTGRVHLDTDSDEDQGPRSPVLGSRRSGSTEEDSPVFRGKRKTGTLYRVHH